MFITYFHIKVIIIDFLTFGSEFNYWSRSHLIMNLAI